MKGQDRFLTSLIDGAKTRFIIPVYQRNYDWKKDNCIQLFNDLVKTAKYNKSSHILEVLFLLLPTTDVATII